LKPLTTSLFAIATLLLPACSGAPAPAPGSTAPAASVSPPAASSPPAARSGSPAAASPPAIVVETAIDEDTMGPTEDGFTMARIAEGILVVRNLPVAAFLISKDAAPKPLPDLFKGLRSPEKTWEPPAFSVSNLRGSLADLAFTMHAPATGQLRDARGHAGAWKVTSATPKRPVWVAETVICAPLATAGGAQMYQLAPEYQAEARRGFRFAFDGPAKGEKLPTPAAGKNGCKYRVLGHPYLALLPDGALLGVGTECTSGNDLLATGKVEGVAWPYQTLWPRLGHGHLAVERWKDGASTVFLLPGGDPVADYAGAEISVGSASDVAVISQVEIAGKTRVFVAQFNGVAWSDTTPPGASESLTPFRTKKGTLHLFARSGSYRRNGSGWDAIRIEVAGKDDACSEETLSDFVETESGDAIFLRGNSACLWRLPAGATTAARVRLPIAPAAGLRGAIELGGWLYLLTDQGSTGMLLRLKL
jgi:hypothetical protein